MWQQYFLLRVFWVTQLAKVVINLDQYYYERDIDSPNHNGHNVYSTGEKRYVFHCCYSFWCSVLKRCSFMNQHLDTWQHFATTRVVTSCDCESTTGHRRVPAPLISIEEPAPYFACLTTDSFIRTIFSWEFHFIVFWFLSALFLLEKQPNRICLFTQNTRLIKTIALR